MPLGIRDGVLAARMLHDRAIEHLSQTKYPWSILLNHGQAAWRIDLPTDMAEPFHKETNEIKWNMIKKGFQMEAGTVDTIESFQRPCSPSS